ncbi:MAG: dUTP diphosphatase [Candidatus Omnitrophica bacterium]|nr:dUTP diphosphatase [Candidatus Omnitrophota bacterium]
MKKITLRLKRKEGTEDLPLPRYMSNGSSGMDLYADVAEKAVIKPNEVKLISAGIYIALPAGYEAQIRPRSGLALKHGITVLNTPGTIDSDYRGLISVILINAGGEEYTVNRGDRIAQMVIKEVLQADLMVVKDLCETERSGGGFGHTGV